MLVSNAGIGLVSPLDDLRVEDWEAMIDVNLKGVLYGIAAALPVFRAQGSGHFVNVVSTAGLRIVPASGTADRGTTGGWAEGFGPAGEVDDETEGEESVALTAREREVLALLAAGASNKAIARALGVSVHTAKFHVASLTEKLGASGRLEAVAIALRTGLIMV